jgi:hypothetical protein
MKQFIIKVSLFVLPVIIMAGVNYYIDNAYIFTEDKEYEVIADIVNHGHNVASLYNFNEFKLYENIIKRKHSSPDIVILGSSRSMEISSELFPNKSVFNASISESSIKEIAATYCLFEQNNIKPREIILNVDPLIFLSFERGNSFRYEFIKPYNIIAEEMHFTHDENNSKAESQTTKLKNKIKELFNPGYFYENLYYGRKDYYATDEKEIDVNVFCNDGSISYNENYRNITKKEAFYKAQKYLEMLSKMEGSDEYNKSNRKLFETFLDYIISEDIKVTFFLASYHPYTAEKLRDSKFKIFEIEKYLKRIAKRKKINIVGSYNPEVTNLSENDFYDGNHPKKQGIEKIFDDYRGI